jgi:voltage-gated potassium channel Kch
VTAPKRQLLTDAASKTRRLQRANPVERRMSKFLREPPSVRTAASVIVVTTALIVAGAGVLIRLLDHHEYPSIWLGMWWAVQTVTTVGYGDVTPKDVAGRVVATFVMLEGIAFVAIVTAAITSTFVARTQQERALAEESDQEQEAARLEARFDELDRRLDRLESLLREQRRD